MQFKKAFSGYSMNDVEACREFYGNLLGLGIKNDMGGIGFVCGGQEVFIYPKEDHKPASYTVLNFVVDDIEASVDELVEKGVNFERYADMEQDDRGIMHGKDVGMGPDIAWFKDPAGNILSLINE